MLNDSKASWMWLLKLTEILTDFLDIIVWWCLPMAVIMFSFLRIVAELAQRNCLINFLYYSIQVVIAFVTPPAIFVLKFQILISISRTHLDKLTRQKFVYSLALRTRWLCFSDSHLLVYLVRQLALLNNLRPFSKGTLTTQHIIFFWNSFIIAIEAA